jgi:hypothetical protein
VEFTDQRCPRPKGTSSTPSESVLPVDAKSRPSYMRRTRYPRACIPFPSVSLSLYPIMPLRFSFYAFSLMPSSIYTYAFPLMPSTLYLCLPLMPSSLDLCLPPYAFLYTFPHMPSSTPYAFLFIYASPYIYASPLCLPLIPMPSLYLFLPIYIYALLSTPMPSSLCLSFPLSICTHNNKDLYVNNERVTVMNLSTKCSTVPHTST